MLKNPLMEQLRKEMSAEDKAYGRFHGILHSKTENSPFNKYFIPTVNVAKAIAEDVVFDI